MEKKSGKQKSSQRSGYISQQWQKAQNGQDFMQRLEEAGYRLAQGDRAKYVVIDQTNRKVESLQKLLPRSVNEQALDAKLGPVHEQLPNTYEALGYSKEKAQEKQEKYQQYMEKVEKGQEQKRVWLAKRREAEASLEPKEKTSAEKVQAMKEKIQTKMQEQYRGRE